MSQIWDIKAWRLGKEETSVRRLKERTEEDTVVDLRGFDRHGVCVDTETCLGPGDPLQWVECAAQAPT